MSDLLRAMADIRSQGASAGLWCFWDGGWDLWIGPDARHPTATGHFREDDIQRIAPWFRSHGSAFAFDKSSQEDPVVQVMANLYASEINCGIVCHRGSGWEVWLGDDFGNGRRAEARLPFEEGDRIAEWLKSEAMRVYSMSEFAKQEGNVLADKA